jgi:hypothetical protein
MQSPDFSAFTTPDGTPASQFWTVVRGQLKNPAVPNDIDRILHAEFEVPASKGYTVSQIKINGQPIQFASQITVFIGMALSATAFSGGGPNQPFSACTKQKLKPAATVNFLQDARLFAAYRAVEASAGEDPLSIPILSLSVAQGSTLSNVAVGLNVNDMPTTTTFTVNGGGVAITVTDSTTIASIPVLLVIIAVEADAAVGDREILVNVPGQPSSPQPAIGLLNVVKAATPVAPSSGLSARVVPSRKSPKPSHIRGRI